MEGKSSSKHDKHHQTAPQTQGMARLVGADASDLLIVERIPRVLAARLRHAAHSRVVAACRWRTLVVGKESSWICSEVNRIDRKKTIDTRHTAAGPTFFLAATAAHDHAPLRLP